MERMKHINDILKESLLDDDIETSTEKSLVKIWVEKNVKCDGKIMFLNAGTVKFTGDVLIKGFEGKLFPENFIVSDVNGDFKIEKCPNLKNINGLFKDYTDVKGSYVISNCPKLESVAGGPMTVKGTLSFTGNKSLKSLAGMPQFVYETIYLMKNGKRFTEKDVNQYTTAPARIVCSVEEDINESAVNEALNEPHLLEFVKQLKDNGKKVITYTREMGVELDKLDSSNVKEYTSVDTKAIKSASEIIRSSGEGTFGFVILVNHNNEYTALIDYNKRCRPIKKGWCPPGLYYFNDSGKQMPYTECMDLVKKSYSIIVVKWDFETRNDFYNKQALRSNAKRGIILNTASQNEEIARANRERYIKLAAQMKAKKDKDFEKIDEEVEEVINEVLKVSQKAKRNPEKYDSFAVKKLNEEIYGERQFVGYRSSNSGYIGSNGLLVLYAQFTESYMDVVKNGGYNFDRSNLKKLKLEIKSKIDRIKLKLKDFI